MSVQITIHTDDQATPFLRNVQAGLTNRAELNRYIADNAEILFFKYIKRIAGLKHRTARALGASPTNYLSRVAESVSSESNAKAATVTLRGDGMARAFRDVTITPTTKKYLTIAVNALSYGKRAREFSDLIPLRTGPRNTLILARERGPGQLEVMYVLVKRVFQKQDRKLLPSDEAILTAAEIGARDYLEAIPD